MVRTMSDTATAPAPTSRPGVVTFIGVILYIQAAIALVAGISMLIWRDNITDWLEDQGDVVTDGAFTGTIIGEFIVAVLLFLAAGGLMRGASGWRMFITVIQAIAMCFAVYALITHHIGSIVYRAVWALFVGTFVLWALWGHDRSAQYFDEN